MAHRAPPVPNRLGTLFCLEPARRGQAFGVVDGPGDRAAAKEYGGNSSGAVSGHRGNPRD